MIKNIMTKTKARRRGPREKEWSVRHMRQQAGIAETPANIIAAETPANIAAAETAEKIAAAETAERAETGERAADGRSLQSLRNSRSKTYDMVSISLFTVLIAICSWISIPTTIPFTLQTFAVFLAVAVLGGRRGTLAVVIYVLLGTIGVPVFSNVTGGIGILLGNTGGYIAGFILSALVMWLMERLFGRKTWVLAVSMVLGLLVCYAAGTAWFMAVYTHTTGAVGLGTVLGWCVLPYLLPDAVKIALALALSVRLRALQPK